MVGLAVSWLDLLAGQRIRAATRTPSSTARALRRAPIAVRRIGRGGEMRIVGVVNTNCRALIEHSVEFLDSG